MSIRERSTRSNRFLHLSVDDVLDSLRELSTFRYVSIWQHPTFAFYRRMHETYGAVFSLYPFWTNGSWSLSELPSNYSCELGPASAWLRWGFHGFDQQTDYRSGVSGSEAASHYSMTVDALSRFAGEQAIDRFPRTHFFSGSVELVRRWRDNRLGITGLLTPDDDRAQVYHLDGAQLQKLASDGYLYDESERLHLLPTDLRLEKAVDPVEELKKRMARSAPSICVFTHENHLSTDGMKRKIESVCRWAAGEGLKWGFPAEKISRELE